VTSITQTSAGRSVQSEELALDRNGAHARVRVSSGDGSMFAIPVALTPGGEIASDSQDRSITCYNMAMGALDHQHADAAPESVLVRYLSSIVPIVLHVQATHDQGPLHTIDLTGMTTGVVHDGESASDAGIIINAAVSAQNGTLNAATFDEVNYLGTPTNIVSRSTCILMRNAKPTPIKST
jgi:hypothetical protein